MKSMDNVQSVHKQCQLNPWSMSVDSVDIVHGLPGQYPVHPDSLDFVQSFHGHCPY